MSEAFFYRERRGMFVVVSLAIWLVLLVLFGRYLPATASVTGKQMNISIHGNEVIGHWQKINGRWKFEKVSKIISINRSGRRKVASVEARGEKMRADRRKAGIASGLASVFPPAQADSSTGQASPRPPSVTASIPALQSKKFDKRTARARLAEEIGRWAKIGERWEWHEATKSPNDMSRSAQGTPNAPKEVRKEDKIQAKWIRRDGTWVFALPVANDLFINI